MNDELCYNDEHRLYIKYVSPISYLQTLPKRKKILMRQLFNRAALLGILMMTAINVWAANVADAQTLIKNTTDKVLATLKTDSSQVHRLVEKVVLPHFNFTKMSRLVLGKHWKRANKNQKRRFIRAFRGLLVRTYAAALVKASKQGVRVKYFSPKNAKTKRCAQCITMKAKVTPRGGKSINVIYAMRPNKKDKWKVYNVTIGGVSLVTTYRTEFTDKVNKTGIDKLIEEIKTKKPK